MAAELENSMKQGNLLDQTSSEIDHELQKAMYVGIELLGMLRHFHHDPRQSAQIRAEITEVAQGSIS